MAALMPRIERPVRLAAIMFGLLAVLSAIVAALVAAFPDPWSPDMKLFAFSLASYFLLTMLMVGVFLALAGMRWRWFYLWMSLPLLALATYCLIVKSYILV